MTKKVFYTSVATALVVLLLCFALFLGVLYQHFSKQLTQELAMEANFISQGVMHNGLDYFDGLDTQHIRITLVDTDGTVLYDSVADPGTLGNHSDRAEIQQAMYNATGVSTRYSETLSERTVNYALRLADGTVLRVSNAQTSVWVLLLSMIQPLIAVLLLALLVALLLSYRASKLIVKPLATLNLNDPEGADTYEELTPFLHRIASQNRELAARMQELHRQQEEFGTITENMSEGFLVVDANETPLSYNASAVRLLGTRQESFDSTSVFAMNRSEPFRRAVNLALAGESNQQMMVENGRYCQVIANPVAGEGKVDGAILVLMDVTEKEQRDALRREFTANVSHELKTPLTSISGIAELMKSDMVKPEDVPRFAESIYKEAHRLIALVEDIINLSRLDDPSAKIQRERVDLEPVVRSNLEILHRAAEKKNISLDVHGEKSVIKGVRAILDELVYNLCDNAIKYNKAGGRVRVDLTNGVSEIKLTVSDTGIGIPEEEQSRVFERFYRVDKSHSKDIGGTGLGLSIVKHAAMFHNAEVFLTSKVGEGTTVCVVFPKNEF